MSAVVGGRKLASTDSICLGVDFAAKPVDFLMCEGTAEARRACFEKKSSPSVPHGHARLL
jgi:hypothetical protein